MTDLACKRALVTVGTRHVGGAIALALAERGADIVISYETPSECAAEIIARVESLGGRCRALQADGTNPGEVKRLVEDAVAWMGGLDILVTNSGEALEDFPCEESLEAIASFLCSNVRRAVLATMAATSHMRAGGRIVMIGSGAICAPPGKGVLSSTVEAAHRGFTKGMARQLKPREITVNLVQPASAHASPGAEESCSADRDQRSLPSRQHGDAVEILAAMVAFVASPQAALMTGSIIAADGGFDA